MKGRSRSSGTAASAYSSLDSLRPATGRSALKPKMSPEALAGLSRFVPLADWGFERAVPRLNDRKETLLIYRRVSPEPTR